MCRWDDGGIRRRERKRLKEAAEKEAELAKVEVPQIENEVEAPAETPNLFDEITREIKNAKKIEKLENLEIGNEKKETKHTSIQDHPCLFYTRRTTNKKVSLKFRTFSFFIRFPKK